MAAVAQNGEVRHIFTFCYSLVLAWARELSEYGPELRAKNTPSHFILGAARINLTCTLRTRSYSVDFQPHRVRGKRGA